jgi:hypothetical protein
MICKWKQNWFSQRKGGFVAPLDRISCMSTDKNYFYIPSVFQALQRYKIAFTYNVYFPLKCIFP